MSPAYSISTDRSRLDVDLIHRYLSTDSYWALNRSLEVVKTSIENSLCFGVYAPGGDQVGFARVVTDYATFAWVADVFVLEEHRGRGLGKLLVREIIAYPALNSIKRILLATADAHELYRRHGGFEPLADPARWMERLLTPTS